MNQPPSCRQPDYVWAMTDWNEPIWVVSNAIHEAWNASDIDPVPDAHFVDYSALVSQLGVPG